MKLIKWSEISGIYPQLHESGFMPVPMPNKQSDYVKLWNLSDWVVSSVAGGCVWLKRKVE